MKNRPGQSYKSILKYLYLLFFLCVLMLVYFGRNYYFAPLVKKVRHPLHPLLRQSGSMGHLLGIIGTVFMLLLLLYSIRKRFKFARNWGDLSVWLNIHIFLGISGPAMVLFHTVFKFSGLVSISFWSMVLVVISGLIGKYIYELIPHSLSGMDLNRIEIEAEEIGATFEIRKIIPADHLFWQQLHDMDSRQKQRSLISIFFLFLEQLNIRYKFYRILKQFKDISRQARKNLLRLVVKRQMIMKKARLLNQTMKILHYWHLIHKPFVIIMFLILLVHVFIAVKMGYVWKF